MTKEEKPSKEKNESKYEKEHWEMPKPFHKIPNYHRYVTIPTSWKDRFVEYFMRNDRHSWFMTEAQRETWKIEILRNWEQYRNVLKWDSARRFDNQLLNMNSLGGGVIVIAGSYGMGKSIIALTLGRSLLALKAKTTGKKYLNYVYWHKKDARSQIRQADNDTVHIIDEDMTATGTGSYNMEVHIKNIFETIRKTGKFVIEAGVNITPSMHKKAVALLIEPFGFNKRFQLNRFIVKDHAENPLWLAWTQRNYKPEEKIIYEGERGTYAEYNARAVEFSSETSGVFSGTSAKDEKIWKNDLVDFWLNKYGNSVPTMNELEYWAIQIGIPQESTATLSRICSVAKREIKAEGKEYSIREEIPEYEGQTQDLQDAICDRMEERGLVDPRRIEALRLRVKNHMSQDDIAVEFGVTQPTISMWLRDGDLAREMGEAFEDVYARKLENEGLIAKVFGGNSPEPDCILYSLNDEPIEVRSLKCFISKRSVTTIPRDELGQAELDLARKEDIPLKMVFYNMWTDKLQAIEDKGQDRFSFKA